MIEWAVYSGGQVHVRGTIGKVTKGHINRVLKAFTFYKWLENGCIGRQPTFITPEKPSEKRLFADWLKGCPLRYREGNLTPQDFYDMIVVAARLGQIVTTHESESDDPNRINSNRLSRLSYQLYQDCNYSPAYEPFFGFFGYFVNTFCASVGSTTPWIGLDP